MTGSSRRTQARFLLSLVALLAALALAPAQALAGNWSQLGASADHTRHNVGETAIGPANVATLKVDWEVTVSGITAAPVTWGGIVYVGSSHGGLHAIDARTGAQLWTVRTNQSVLGSPAVANGIVHVATSAATVYGFDARTGAFLWQTQAGSGMVSSPVVANGVVFTGALDGTVHALDAATGAPKWSAPASAAVETTPAVSGGTVYVTSSDEKLHAYDAATGRGLWSVVVHALTAPRSPTTSSPSVANGVVYVSHGQSNIIAFDAQTGTRLWAPNFACSPTRVDGSPAIANGVVIASNACGEVWAYPTMGGVPSWLHASMTCCGASPLAVANGVVYVGEVFPSGSPELRALDAGTGMKLWTFPAGLAAPPIPVVSNGTVYLATDEGLLYALRIFDDADGDRVWDSDDNCRLVPNPWQEDRDLDGVGDACDNAPQNFNPNQDDADKDDVGDAIDNCRLTANKGQEDFDHDAVGDACDNAPYDYNPGQNDTDGDGIPDVNDLDDDNDGIYDGQDNCPAHANPRQEDSNGDGIGDACEGLLTPEEDLHFAFVRRDEHFERFQLGVQACRPCPPPDSTFKARISIDGELPVELQLYDPKGELVATGSSGDPFDFEARVDESGSSPGYRLDVHPSPDFKLEGEYPYTAHLELPRPD